VPEGIIFRGRPPGPSLEALHYDPPWCRVVCGRYVDRRPVAFARVGKGWRRRLAALSGAARKLAAREAGGAASAGCGAGDVPCRRAPPRAVRGSIPAASRREGMMLASWLAMHGWL
jgi:hypothetical protein